MRPYTFNFDLNPKEEENTNEILERKRKLLETLQTMKYDIENQILPNMRKDIARIKKSIEDAGAMKHGNKQEKEDYQDKLARDIFLLESLEIGLKDKAEELKKIITDIEEYKQQIKILENKNKSS